METTVQVTLAVGNDIEGKLAELAGGESKSGEFLTQLIRRLHGEQQASKGDVDLARIISKAQLLADRQQEYVRTIRILQAHLKKMTESHGELMATVQYLIEAYPRPTNLSDSDNRSYH
jgi:hypothetical protein